MPIPMPTASTVDPPTAPDREERRTSDTPFRRRIRAAWPGSRERSRSSVSGAAAIFVVAEDCREVSQLVPKTWVRRVVILLRGQGERERIDVVSTEAARARVADVDSSYY
jgi:hypothetical protein